MRKHILRLVVAIITFVVGICVGFLGKHPVTKNYNSKEIYEPLQLEPIKVRKVCELHGLVMTNEVVHVVTGYDSPEAALFESHLVGCSNTWVFWRVHAEAMMKEFPHGYKYAYRKCELNEKGCKELDVCPVCRAAEIRWVDKAIREKL